MMGIDGEDSTVDGETEYRKHVYRECVDMFIDMCRGLVCGHVRGMYVDTCVDMFLDMCVDMCLDMCVDMRV